MCSGSLATDSMCPSCGVQAQITLPAVDEKKKVIEDVDKDRKYAIDAAIVRTMKSRKVLNHQHVRPSSRPSNPPCWLLCDQCSVP